MARSVILIFALFFVLILSSCNPVGGGAETGGSSADQDVSLEEVLKIAAEEAKRGGFSYDDSETAVWWTDHNWRVELSPRDRPLSIGGSDFVVWISRTGEILKVR